MDLPRYQELGLELIREVKKRHLKCALFDFDGTLSLLRAGWREVMIAMMVETIAHSDARFAPGEIEHSVCEFVDELTGEQTIFQMIRLCQEIRARGGHALEPLQYKKLYHDRLLQCIHKRLERLIHGEADPDEYLVSGARHILQQLRKYGIRCYLASGTDQCFVEDEAKLLNIAQYFEIIYGAQDDYEHHTKRAAISAILSKEIISGHELLSFGDGYVEIQESHQIGALVVGVASDENNPGRTNEWKRERLIRAGADIVVPDFGASDALLSVLLNQWK